MEPRHGIPGAGRLGRGRHAVPGQHPRRRLDSLARLVEHYEAIGATGLTVLGVFGEAAALTAEERRQVLETVVECTDLPLVVG